MLIGKTGANRNVLAFQPSLIINEDNIDELIEAYLMAHCVMLRSNSR